MKNKNKLFINMAKLVAQQSTCARLKVGAVLVKESRVVSIGFNGVPSGKEHCEDYFQKVYEKDFASKYSSVEEYFKSQDFYNAHGLFSNDNELHAEQNALLFAAKSGIATENSDLYITLSPCVHCAKVIIASGIKRVYFAELYDRSTEGVNLLIKNGIECIHLQEKDLL